MIEIWMKNHLVSDSNCNIVDLWVESKVDSAKENNKYQCVFFTLSKKIVWVPTNLTKWNGCGKFTQLNLNELIMGF